MVNEEGAIEVCQWPFLPIWPCQPAGQWRLVQTSPLPLCTLETTIRLYVLPVLMVEIHIQYSLLTELR